mmetsp:Transcript_15276/g.50158  ORF Transcript_15276/g.50158 Transcript_15276/m.50158 type:complete len:301 (-) Transcript_15276:407-1309(-)
MILGSDDPQTFKIKNYMAASVCLFARRLSFRFVSIRHSPSLNLLSFRDPLAFLASNVPAALAALAFLRRLPLAHGGGHDGRGAEKRLEAVLRTLSLRRFQLFQRRPHAVLAELFFSHQKRHHAFLVRSRELQLQAFAIRHVRVFEKLPRFVERPVLGDDVFRRVDVLQKLLDAAVLFDQRKRLDRPDAFDAVAVIAPAHDAHVNELVPGQVQFAQGFVEVKLQDGFALARGGHEVPRQLRARKAKRVHVFARGGVHQTRAAKRRARGFGFARGFENGQPEQARQTHDLLRLLARYSHGSL